MITGAFINLAYFLLHGIISFLPASQGFPADALAAATTIGGYVGIFDPIISIATLAATLTLVFSVEIGIFGFKTGKWIIAHIPFIGGRG